MTEEFFLPQYYHGLVVKKYVDSSQHLYKKLVIKEKYGTKVILFNGEVGDIWDFIKIGDTISKVEGNNDIAIRRLDLDTIIQLRFYESE